MQPNQPVGPSSPGQNPYDFIINPGKPPKKRMFGGGNSLTKRIILVVGGALILMMLIAIVTSLLTSGSSGNTNSLKSLVAQQEELTRVATIGAEKARDTSIRSKAAITKMSVTTQQQKLTGYLESRNIKLSKEELAAKKNNSTDEALESASSSNNFDSAFDTELTKQLNDYATALQDAFNSTSNENGKAVLSDSFTSTAYILDLK